MSELIDGLHCPFLLLLGTYLILSALWDWWRDKGPNLSELENKILVSERDLATARTELSTRTDAVGLLTAELETSRAALQEKDSTLGELNEKLALALAAGAAAAGTSSASPSQIEEHTTALQAKDDEIASLKSVIESSKKKFAEAADKAKAEIEAAKKAVPDTKLVEEAASIRVSLKAKDEEVARLNARINTLASMELQLKDRDLKLKNLGAKITQIEQAKATELAILQNEQSTLLAAKTDELKLLNQQVTELTTFKTKALKDLEVNQADLAVRDQKLRKLDDQLLELENKLKAAESARKAAVGDKESEGQKFKLRIGELEALAVGATAAIAAAESMKPEHAAKVRDLEISHKLQLGEKDAEVARLRLRIQDLEKLDARFAAEQSEMQSLHLAALRDKDAAISLLQLRLKDGEALEARIKELDSKLNAQANDAVRQAKLHAEEIATLRLTHSASLSELTSKLELKASELDSAELALNELQTHQAALLVTSESKVAELTALVQQLEKQDDESKAKLDEVETDLQAALAETVQLRASAQTQAEEFASRLRQLHQQVDNEKFRTTELETALVGSKEAAGIFESRVKTLESELGNRDEALSREQFRIKELEAALGHRDEALGQREFRIKELESALGCRDEELGKQQFHFNQLELAFNERAEELEKRQWRIGELEAFVAHRDEEIGKYKWRISELETLADEVAQRDWQLADLKARHQIALDQKDEQLGKFRWRIGELEALATELSVTEIALQANQKLASEWERRHKDAVSLKDHEITQLTKRVAEIGVMAAALGNQAEQFRQTEKSHRAQLFTKDTEIANLTRRVASLGVTTTRVGQLEEQHKSAALAHQKEIKQLETEIAQLNLSLVELGNVKVKADSFEVELNSLRQQLDYTEAEAREVVELRGKLAALNVQFSQTAQSKDAELKRLRNRIQKLEKTKPFIVEKLVEVPVVVPEPQAQTKTSEPSKRKVFVKKHGASPVAIKAKRKPLTSESSSAKPEVSKPVLHNVKAAKPAKATSVTQVQTPKTKPLSAREQMNYLRKHRPGKGQYDNLKLIHGVGPVLEKLLHKHGIYFFKQVAKWKETDIDFVDEKLNRFKGRIRRDDWRGSAFDEHVKKYKKKP